MTQKITREEEATIPQFHSHEEAKKWFKEKYGKDFILTDREPVGDEMCYFYVLVIDRAEYTKGRRELEKNRNLEGFDFLFSHQPIQIMESGGVHVVH